jgi:hypothetical protein
VPGVADAVMHEAEALAGVRVERFGVVGHAGTVAVGWSGSGRGADCADPGAATIRQEEDRNVSPGRTDCFTQSVDPKLPRVYKKTSERTMQGHRRTDGARSLLRQDAR